MVKTYGLCWNRSPLGEVLFYRRYGEYLIPYAKTDAYVFCIKGMLPKDGREWFAKRLPYLSPEDQAGLVELTPMPGKPFIGFSEDENIVVKGCRLLLRPDKADFVIPDGSVRDEIDCYFQLEEAYPSNDSDLYNNSIRRSPFLQLQEVGGEGGEEADLYMVLPYIGEAQTLGEYLGYGPDSTSFYLVSETMRILTLFHRCSLSNGDLGNPDNWLVKESHLGTMRVFLIDLDGHIDSTPGDYESDWYSLINLLMDVLFLSEEWMSENQYEIDDLRFGDSQRMDAFREPMRELVESEEAKVSPYYSSLQDLYRRVLSYCG